MAQDRDLTEEVESMLYAVFGRGQTGDAAEEVTALILERAASTADEMKLCSHEYDDDVGDAIRALGKSR